MLEARRWWNLLRPRRDEKLVARVERSHARLAEYLAILNGNMEGMHMDIQKLTQEVRETQGVIASAAKLIKDTAHAIRQYKTDQVALDKLADDLDRSQRELADAVVAAGEGDETGGPVETGEGDDQDAFH